MQTITEITAKNKEEYDKRPYFKAGDGTFVKQTDVVEYSAEGIKTLRKKENRMGWLVGVHKNSFGDICFIINWWGRKSNSSYHHSFIKKSIINQ